jgi:maltose-binding protein MalE
MRRSMRIRSLAVFVLAVFAVGVTLATAEEKFGVKVFDGAKYDADTSQALGAAMKVDAACYRTSAPVAQVNEFYKKQPGMAEVHASAKGGMFKKGDISVTIQSPWMDMKTHQQMKDTLISIVKNN